MSPACPVPSQIASPRYESSIATRNNIMSNRLMRPCVLCVILGVTGLASMAVADESPRLTRLTCEYLTDPAGMDVSHPRLSW